MARDRGNAYQASRKSGILYFDDPSLILAVDIDPDSTDDQLESGQVVKYHDDDGGQKRPVVTKIATGDDNGDVAGVLVARGLFNDKFDKSRSATMARKGAIIWMKAASAIAGGAEVRVVLDSPGEVTVTGATAIIGRALFRAADDEYVAVELT